MPTTQTNIQEPTMHWQDRRMRRPALNEPGHAHELTFTCFRGYPFSRPSAPANGSPTR
jgi:hypothetical protein